MGVTAATKVLVDALPAAPGTGSDATLVNHSGHHETAHAALKEVYAQTPRVYRANLLLAGASVSVETEHANTLGAAVTASHAGTGDYRLTFASAVMTANKTFVPGCLISTYSGADLVQVFTSPPPSTTVLQIRSLVAGSYADVSVRVPILIEVYP